MTTQDLFLFLDRLSLGVLTTISPEQRPQAALIGFAVTPELELIYDTVKSSRKYRNLSANPKAAFVAGWEDERTLQYEGEAEELQGSKLGQFKEVYFRKHPDCRAHEQWPDIVYFVIRPTWMRFSDYTVGAQQIFEFNF